jgi:hypothetical protein
MKPPRHAKHELDALRPYTVPTLANALETFGVSPVSGYCGYGARVHRSAA